MSQGNKYSLLRAKGLVQTLFNMAEVAKHVLRDQIFSFWGSKHALRVQARLKGQYLRANGLAQTHTNLTRGSKQVSGSKYSFLRANGLAQAHMNTGQGFKYVSRGQIFPLWGQTVELRLTVIRLKGPSTS